LQPGSLVDFSKGDVTIGQRAPHLGEHNEEILGRIVSTTTPESVEPSNGPSGGPLSGIVALDFATFFAAPYGLSILSNLGARVIKVEAPGGDYSRYSVGGLLSFHTTQGKESIAIDLKSTEGREVVHSLITEADVLLHNFRPGVPAKLGVDYATVRRLNPGLIYLYGASYGETGPDASRPAFHPIAGAIAGNALRQVGEGFPPNNIEHLSMDEIKRHAWRLLKANEGNPDVNAALAVATAILLGLNLRDRTGEGMALQTTMIASNMLANSDELISYPARPEGPKVDADLFGLGACYRLYEASEGWVFLACVVREEWVRFCQAVDRPDLIQMWQSACDPPADRNQRSVASVVADLLRSRPSDEWERIMLEREVPLVAVEMRDPGQVWLEDEIMKEIGCVEEVESPVYGRYKRHGSLQQFSGETLRLGAWEPVGGHSRQILLELGYSEDVAQSMIDRGIVETP
jgi:crotonobetainyl-CoA:carnitine CoA-transferase CaiB-like acyl-CoA transferase